MGKQIERFKLWKRWAEYSGNTWFYKVAVLMGWIKSPTFETYRMMKPICDGLGEAIRKIAEESNKQLEN